MDTAQISAWFHANKVEVLGVGAAAVAGLALLQRKKSGTGAAAGVTAGAVAPGTIPAGSVVPATADSSAFDAYNALQDEIGTLAQQGQAQQNEGAAQTGAGGSGVGAAVTPPLASQLYAPSGSGQLVSYSNGLYEVEGDGSLYHLSPSEWSGLIKSNGGKKPSATQLSGQAPTSYGGSGNLANFIKKANPNQATPVGPTYRTA